VGEPLEHGLPTTVIGCVWSERLGRAEEDRASAVVPFDDEDESPFVGLLQIGGSLSLFGALMLPGAAYGIRGPQLRRWRPYPVRVDPLSPATGVLTPISGTGGRRQRGSGG
jgi:hypothetical protein